MALAEEADDIGPASQDERDQLRLLLVSENVSAARLLREVLEDVLESQASVTWVATWEEAQADLDRLPSDLVIVHLSGPNVFGLAAPLPEVPILVVTGLTDDDVSVRILR